MEKQARSAIKVYVRVRPLIASERHTDRVVDVLSDGKTIRVAHDSYNHMQIKFDNAFHPEFEQEDIYSHFRQVVPRVLDGYNVTVFAYGQTGSGKTYTMFGQMENEDKIQQGIEASQRGVIPRSIEQLFGEMKGNGKVSVFCSFLQIYNEKIYDLLQDGEKPKPLSIHESKAEGIFVEGLTEFGVNKAEDCMELLMKGVNNRVIRQTSMNAKSSRSHSIFQLLVEIQDKTGGILKGRLNLCDLAGSEKINKKESMSQAQMKELKNINLSLTTLGKVIYSLSSGDRKATGAFRESKLTRLLQESLTGNTYTFIMANLSPSVKNIEETVNTLKFVERANHITLKVKPTEIASSNPDAVVKLNKEIEYLKDLLQLKKQGVNVNPEAMPEQIRSLRKENQHLKNEYVSKDELEKMVKENRNMKKEIYNMQVKLEQTEGTQTSIQSDYADMRKKEMKKDNNTKKEEMLKRDFYMPSSRGEPSSRNSQDSKRLSNSLLQAGQSIVFNKRTIEDAPNRGGQERKKHLALRLQEMEDKNRNEEYRLIDDYQSYERKTRGRYSPPKGNGKAGNRKEESQVVKTRKKVDYSDKIKELEARLFGK